MPLTLVTGTPGWLSNRLVCALLDGLPGLPPPDEPRCLRCLVQPGADAAGLPAGPRLEICRGDLRDPQAARAFCEGAEGATLFHLAGIVHPARFTREFYQVNADGSRRLLEAAAAAGARRAVIVSSNSAAGANPRRDHRFDETSPLRPYQNYGRSKLLLEQAAREFHERGRLETVVLRPCWFYGPGQPIRQTTFFRMIRQGRAPIVGDGGSLRSLSYVDSVCQALLLAEAAPEAAGQTYWVADARPYSMNEIVDTVEGLMEREFGLTVARRRLRLPDLASRAAGWADTLLQSVGLYEQRVHVLSEMNQTIACTIDKARRELGYAPLVELEEGMRRSLAWCVAQGIAL